MSAITISSQGRNYTKILFSLFTSLFISLTPTPCLSSEIKPEIKAIIFDMDETIIRSNSLWFRSKCALIEQYGVPLTEENKQYLLSREICTGFTKAIPRIIKKFNFPVTYDEIMVDFNAHIARLIPEEVTFIEGFTQFIPHLKSKNLKLALATNCDKTSLGGITQFCNLTDIFGKHIYSIADVGNKRKPAPDVYLHAARQLGVDPSECLVFEDSLKGFRAAQAAGMQIIAIKNRSNQEFFNQYARAGITTYHEAEALVNACIRDHKLATIKEKFPAVIFDMDETIVHSKTVWKQAFMRAYVKNGLDLSLVDLSKIDLKKIEQEVGRTVPEAVAYFSQLFAIQEPNEKLVAAVITELSSLFSTQTIEYINGFEAFHTVLKQAGIETALATNCPRIPLDAISERLDFDQKFNGHVYSAEDLDSRPKPDPALFLHAAKKLKRDPSECIVFEDSHAGFTAAQQAGMNCIAIKNRKNKAFFNQYTLTGIDSYDAALDALYQIACE